MQLEQPVIPRHFQLGKHLAKLSIDDSEDSVIILRPRYEMKPERIRSMINGVEQWKKQARCSLRILIVPHDFDVFAMEVSKQEEGVPG